MKNPKASARKAAKHKKIAFNAAAFRRITHSAGVEMVTRLLPEIVIKTIEAEHGTGLLGSPKRENPEEQKRVIDVMSSLVPLISASASLAFAEILDGILSDTDMRKYLIARTSAIAGRDGGRKPSGTALHLQWLEQRLQLQEIQSPLGCLSDKEHFRELLLADEIDGEDDEGNLQFTESALMRFGWREGKREPLISMSAVSRTMTKIRKNASKKLRYAAKGLAA